MAIDDNPSPPPPQGPLSSAERARLPRPRRATSLPEDWFWSKVDRSGGPDACWPWIRVTTNKGYGCLSVGGSKKKGGRTQLAHRVAIVLFGVDLKERDVVCHQCDNKLCCNPRHLKVGGYSDNLIEAYQRYRRPRLPKPLLLRNLLASAKSALESSKGRSHMKGTGH